MSYGSLNIDLKMAFPILLITNNYIWYGTFCKPSAIFFELFLC